MGAWGYGPFESDGALDVLHELAERSGAKSDAEFDIIADTADQLALAAALRVLLTDITRPTADGERREDTCQGAYTAAGLVAAALTDVSPDSVGTSLFDRLADTATGTTPPTELDLTGHCGYLALITRATADTLCEPASTAVAALRTETGWLDMWTSCEDVLDQLTQLAALLTGPGSRSHTGAGSSVGDGTDSRSTR